MLKTLESCAAVLVLTFLARPALAQEPQVNGQNAVTLIGCVETEIDYRTRTTGNASGIGENEIVLSHALPAAGAPPSPPRDYALNGQLEIQMTPDVGVQVELVGFIEDNATHQAPGQPVRLPRVFITSWQPSGGSCSSQ